MKEPPLTPFPTLELSPQRREWPTPPFAWRHVPPPSNDEVQACAVETSWGAKLDGEMLDFDPAGGCMRFRVNAQSPAATVTFSRLRKLVLTAPLMPAPKMPGAPAEHVPFAAQERPYRLQTKDSMPLTGRTAGYVNTEAGLYLFTPMDADLSLQRVFVPRCAYTACEFGPSAEELASQRWIATRPALLAAIDRQQSMPLQRLGQALINLGLVTSEQLQHALARQRGDQPLGEMLVASGIISRSDLHTALAHKMGYPLVDLTRFPVDEGVVRMLPLRLAMASRALPLMVNGERLIVAVDRLSRIDKLHNLHVFTGMQLVPVLASRTQIMLALTELIHRDVWSHNVFASGVFAPTTI